MLLSYVIFSLVSICAKKYYFHDDITWRQGILDIFAFKALTYAWYINLWIGLYVLIPFINIGWKAIPTRRMKEWLLLILFLLTALPDFGNRYGFSLFPYYWETTAYPLCFYLCGAYIREYRPSFDKRKLLLVTLGLLWFQPVANLFIPHPTYVHFVGDENGIIRLPATIGFFLLIYDMDVKSLRWRTVLQHIALCSLDIYLISPVFDRAYYAGFRERFFENQSQFGPYIPLVIMCVFLSSYAMASLKRVLFRGLERRIESRRGALAFKLT